MTDSTLQRVWDSRDAISRRCNFDSRALVKFYQSRQKTETGTNNSPFPSKAQAPIAPVR